GRQRSTWRRDDDESERARGGAGGGAVCEPRRWLLAHVGARRQRRGVLLGKRQLGPARRLDANRARNARTRRRWTDAHEAHRWWAAQLWIEHTRQGVRLGWGRCW